ncbi:hypothetical protein C1H46_015650 [Malus baccata]|uniref:Uncharacterized protein n=1 Tax=Malus baccata TaxID=106549 RepID=A0A540MIZ1_MALBA|nr:hypothetical protein C1H46_015650 [Malus baccata]
MAPPSLIANGGAAGAELVPAPVTGRFVSVYSEVQANRIDHALPLPSVLRKPFKVVDGPASSAASNPVSHLHCWRQAFRFQSTGAEVEIGVVLSGGQAPGDHNVISGIFGEGLNYQFVVQQLIAELNEILAHEVVDEDGLWKKKLTCQSLELFDFLPEATQEQLMVERNPRGNVQVAKIEIEKMLIQMVETDLEKRKQEGSYNASSKDSLTFSGTKEDVFCQPTLILPTAMYWVMLLELSFTVEKLG